MREFHFEMGGGGRGDKVGGAQCEGREGGKKERERQREGNTMEDRSLVADGDRKVVRGGRRGG